MAAGQCYAVRVFGDYLDQEFVNVYAYQQTIAITGNAANELTNGIDNHILFPLTGCVGDDTHYTRIEAFAIENPSDYDEKTPGNDSGNRAFTASARAPSYLAFGLRSNRGGAGTRASYKRFCGIGETDMEANFLEAAFLAIPSVEDLQVNLGTTIVSAGGDEFVPVQVKSGWELGIAPILNFLITAYGIPYLTSQVSRRP